MSDPTVVIATPHDRYDQLEQRVRARLRGYRVIRVRERHELTRDTLQRLAPSWIFLPHWSWLIPAEVHGAFDCVIFHMTDLPYGRGGSPLQNLIVRGHKHTKLSALKCVAQLDAGPIYGKRELSLAGTAEEILARAALLMEAMICEIVLQRPQPQAQSGEVVEFQRRRPEECDLARAGDLERVYDFIRMLDGTGYPPAFLEHECLRLEFSEARLVRRDGEEYVESKVRIRSKSQ